MNDTTETDWAEAASAMNERFLAAMERNVRAQTEFVETWMDAVAGDLESIDDADGPDGALQAYQIWMDAAEEQFEELFAGMEGEAIDPATARDRWLDAANQAFKETTRTTSFAALTGHALEEALAAHRQVDEQAERTLHALGFATRSDVIEVGERLVEIERRLHAIEQALPRE